MWVLTCCVCVCVCMITYVLHFTHKRPTAHNYYGVCVQDDPGPGHYEKGWHLRVKSAPSRFPFNSTDERYNKRAQMVLMNNMVCSNHAPIHL